MWLESSIYKTFRTPFTLVFSTDHLCSVCTGMAALNGGLGSGGLSNGSGSTMEALTQAAYSGIQQYAAAALPSLYSQSLLSQQNVSAAGSQKEGEYMEV